MDGAIERAAFGAGQVAAIEAAREKEELLHAVRSSAGVRQLAANPLLLTILALMKRQGVELPERRVELYDRYVAVLLKHWNLARGLAGRPARELDLIETMRILAPVALWMQRTAPGAGLVREPDLRREVQALFEKRGHEDPEVRAHQFLADVQEHAGLLIDRGGKQYGFLHLTFQEYLGGVALAQLGQLGVGSIIEEIAAHVGEDPWREVSRLTIAYLAVIQGREDAAEAVLGALLSGSPGPPGEAAILCGLAVLDAGRGGVPLPVRQRVIDALLETMQAHGRVPAPRRAEAGRVLAWLGDPREHVTKLDAMEFCYVPAGPFVMGSGDDYEIAGDEEKPQSICEVPYDCWIARFPVTTAQWREFAMASEDPIDSRSRRGDANAPVGYVNWFQAQAFCEWLTQRWRGKLLAGWQVCLPSGPEWEKAARGGLEIPSEPVRAPPHKLVAHVPVATRGNDTPNGHKPWGPEQSFEDADYSHSQEARPSAVGCFPLGARPYGSEEMYVEVWEWTRTESEELGREEITEDQLAQGAPGVSQLLLLCGGSWRQHVIRGLRPPMWVDANASDAFVGFRVVLSPSSDEPRIFEA